MVRAVDPCSAQTEDGGDEDPEPYSARVVDTAEGIGVLTSPVVDPCSDCELDVTLTGSGD